MLLQIACWLILQHRSLIEILHHPKALKTHRETHQRSPLTPTVSAPPPGRVLSTASVLLALLRMSACCARQACSNLAVETRHAQRSSQREVLNAEVLQRLIPYRRHNIVKTPELCPFFCLLPVRGHFSLHYR